MVDWDAIETALTLFTRNAVPNGTPVIWARQSHVIKKSPYVTLDFVGGTSSLGHDDVTRAEPVGGDGSAHDIRVTGHREFTVSFTVRSTAQKVTRSARNTVERIRSSLHHPSLLSLLNVAGVGFVEALASVSRDEDHGGRLESVESLDVRFSTLADLQVAAQTEDILDAVTVSGELQDLDGDPVVTIPATTIPES